MKHKRLYFAIAAPLSIFVALTSQAEARSSSEFNQDIGVCSAQTDKGKRLNCFERLARDAVAELDKQRTVAMPPTSAIQAPDKPKAGKYDDFIAKAKTNITSKFKDPDAVQWRNLVIGLGAIKVLCGELNAKNSYGAYVGFKRFYASPDLPTFKDIDGDSTSFAFGIGWENCEENVVKVE